MFPTLQWILTICATMEAQEDWSGWHIPSPGDLPNPGIKLESPELQVDSLPAELPGKPPFSPRECLIPFFFFKFPSY